MSPIVVAHHVRLVWTVLLYEPFFTRPTMLDRWQIACAEIRA